LKKDTEVKCKISAESERSMQAAKAVEEKNNIKLLHQLKKAHKTIDQMQLIID
jgi:hypothetical protein